MVKHEINVFTEISIGSHIGKDLRNYPYVLKVGDVVVLRNGDVFCEAEVVQVEGTLIIFMPQKFV